MLEKALVIEVVGWVAKEKPEKKSCTPSVHVYISETYMEQNCTPP
jgi:hypothetical protein